MKDKNIIFMGTPYVAAEYLKYLNNNNIKVKAVFTQPPIKQSRGMKIIKSPVHLLSDQINIKVFHPKNFDQETINKIKEFKPDLIIVMAYGKILSKDVLELPKYGCINIHVSILPRWRGAAPIEHTLMNGDKETGISIIKLIEQLDAGPIIAQQKFLIPTGCNKLQLINSLTKIGTELLVSVIPKIFKGEIEYKDQNKKDITYANKITTQIRKVNFNNYKFNIINHIRAHAPKPGTWFFLNKERIKIIDAKVGSAKGIPSTILNEKFEIACKDGSIVPLKLQREGKNVVTKEEFLRGYQVKVGDVINA